MPDTDTAAENEDCKPEPIIIEIPTGLISIAPPAPGEGGRPFTPESDY